MGLQINPVTGKLDKVSPPATWAGIDHSLLTNLDYASAGHTGFLWVSSWTSLATTWSASPTLYDTQATYKVYEYTYWSTKYYRRVYNTYSPATDIFYTLPVLTVPVATRALSI